MSLFKNYIASKNSRSLLAQHFAKYGTSWKFKLRFQLHPRIENEIFMIVENIQLPLDLSKIIKSFIIII
jgi:hypothetical protein